MASQPCWRCLLRPTNSLNALPIRSPHVAVPAAAAFSTTIPRPKKALVLKRKKTEKKTGKPPAPGERKALRKMIVLSNTNAFAVPSLQEMSAENVSSAEHRATVLSIPDAIVSRLRSAEAFQPKQRWKMFRKPSIVLRSTDLRLAQMMDDAKDSKNVVRQVMVGERGSGKSLYLVQAMASAMLKGWIVITIPEGQDLTNAHTEYGPIQGTRPVIYQQKTYTASLLQRMISANPQLADIQTTMEHQLSIPIPSSLSLSKLATLGVNDPALAQPIFEAIMKELTVPGRPPLLLTLDGFNHVNSLSEYRSSSFQPIHSHDLYLVQWFLSHLSGRAPLPNGGAVLAAMTRSNGPHVRTLDDRLEHLEKQQSVSTGKLQLKKEDSIILPYLQATGQEALATQVPDLDPFVKYDTRVLDIFSLPSNGSSAPPSESKALSSWSSITPATCPVEIKRFTGLTKMEAKSLMEYWAQSGVLRTEVSERFVGEMWAVAGGGLPGEMERTALGMRF